MAFNEEDTRVARKYTHLQASAHSRGKEFGLNLSDVRRLLRKKTCSYTGVQLTEPEPQVSGETNTPVATDRTIDRIDPSVGYHPHNVVSVCHLANSLKEQLLEGKLTQRGGKIACDWSFLKSFVSGLDKIGYKE